MFQKIEKLQNYKGGQTDGLFSAQRNHRQYDSVAFFFEKIVFVFWGGLITMSRFPNSSSSSEIKSINVTLSKNQTLKSVLYWLVRFESNTLYCTDYDLKLYDANSNLVASSATAFNNAELIKYKAAAAGTYRLVVYQYGAFKGESGIDWLALSYNI